MLTAWLTFKEVFHLSDKVWAGTPWLSNYMYDQQWSLSNNSSYVSRSYDQEYYKLQQKYQDLSQLNECLRSLTMYSVNIYAATLSLNNNNKNINVKTDALRVIHNRKILAYLVPN